MTRAQLDELRSKWNKRLFDLRGDLLGNNQQRKYRAKGAQLDRLQAQMSALQTCINELGRIIDEPVSVSGV